MNQISYVTLIYLFCTILSLLFFYLHKKMYPSNHKKRYPGVFLTIGVIDFGHFLMSISRNIYLAIFANRLVYLGTIILLVFAIFVTLDLCNIEPNKVFQYFFIVLSFVVYVLTFTGGSFISLYYKEVTFDVYKNVGHLHKIYGPLHNLYLIYVLFVFGMLLMILGYSHLYKKTKYNINSAILIIAILENIFVWLIEKYLGVTFELLVVSYAILEVLLLVLFENVQEVEKMNRVMENLFNKDIKTIQDVMNAWEKDYNLTQREMEVLKLLLDNVARIDIAQALFISEHTVKKHTAHIYEKMNVKSRNELLYKLNEELASE